MQRDQWTRVIVAKCARCERSLFVEAPVGSSDSEDFVEFANELAQAVIDGWKVRKHGYMCPQCAANA